MADESNNELEGFLDDINEADGTELDEIESRIEEMDETDEITLKKGNFEELAVLMLQDLKLDMLKIQKYLAEKGDFEIEEE